MKYKVTKNMFVVGKLYKQGTVVEIADEDTKYFKEGIQKVITAEKPKKKSGDK